MSSAHEFRASVYGGSRLNRAVQKAYRERVAAGLIKPDETTAKKNDEHIKLVSAENDDISDLPDLPSPPTAFKKREKINRYRPTIEQIQHAICEKFDISTDELLARRHNKEITTPRFIAMFLAKKLTVCSFPELGRKFGGRDHTTVLNAVRKAQKRIVDDDNFAKLVEELGAGIILARNLSLWEDRMTISDASQLAALQTASDLAHGRVKLSASQTELFDAQLEAIRQRIKAAAAKRRHAPCI